MLLAPLGARSTAAGGVLVVSNLVLAGGLFVLAAAEGPVSLFGAWAILGIGMTLGLYDSGLATLTALYGREARGAITGITLIAGFASTVSWPLSSVLNLVVGWPRPALFGQCSTCSSDSHSIGS